MKKCIWCGSKEVEKEPGKDEGYTNYCCKKCDSILVVSG